MATNPSWSEELPKGTVPNLVGLTSANADTQVSNAGFIGTSSTTSPIDDSGGSIGSGNLNKVISQTETAGSTIPLGEIINYVIATPYFPPYFPPFFPPFFPPHFPPFFPPYFPPFFPPHFPPFFPPFFPPHFPPFFPPFFPPHFPPFFPPFFPPAFGPYFPPFFPPSFTKDGTDLFLPGIIKRKSKDTTTSEEDENAKD